MNYDKVIADLAVRVQELEGETKELGQTIDVLIQTGFLMNAAIAELHRKIGDLERFVSYATDAIIMVNERIDGNEVLR